jgi:hypothetical protein
VVNAGCGFDASEDLAVVAEWVVAQERMACEAPDMAVATLVSGATTARVLALDCALMLWAASTVNESRTARLGTWS